MSERRNFSNYDRRLISVLEILGAYFTDTYFNYIHTSANNYVKVGKSLTDEYVRQVNTYVHALKTDKGSFQKIVTDLHRYFQRCTQHSTISFADFVDRIVKHFIPPEYYDLLKIPEKDENLGIILADLVASLGTYATSPEILPRIIDNRQSYTQVTIRMLQDEAVQILLSKRSEIHNKFLSRIGQAKDSVSRDVVEGMKKAIKKLMRENVKQKEELYKTQERLKMAEEDLRDSKKKEAKYRSLIFMLKSQIENGKNVAAYLSATPAPEMIGEANRYAVEPRLLDDAFAQPDTYTKPADRDADVDEDADEDADEEDDLQLKADVVTMQDAHRAARRDAKTKTGTATGKKAQKLLDDIKEHRGTSAEAKKTLLEAKRKLKDVLGPVKSKLDGDTRRLRTQHAAQVKALTNKAVAAFEKKHAKDIAAHTDARKAFKKVDTKLNAAQRRLATNYNARGRKNFGVAPLNWERHLRGLKNKYCGFCKRRRR